MLQVCCRFRVRKPRETHKRGGYIPLGSLEYGLEKESGLGIGLHARRQDGNFSEFFNGVPGSYTDYSV